jgi:hypothetical protein
MTNNELLEQWASIGASRSCGDSIAPSDPAPLLRPIPYAIHLMLESAHG